VLLSAAHDWKSANAVSVGASVPGTED